MPEIIRRWGLVVLVLLGATSCSWLEYRAWWWTRSGEVLPAEEAFGRAAYVNVAFGVRGASPAYEPVVIPFPGYNLTPLPAVADVNCWYHPEPPVIPGWQPAWLRGQQVWVDGPAVWRVVPPGPQVPLADPYHLDQDGDGFAVCAPGTVG